MEPIECICVADEGCDAEGDPGCEYCRALDGEFMCPAEFALIDGDYERPRRRCDWVDEYNKRCVYRAEHTVDHFVWGWAYGALAEHSDGDADA